MVSFRLLVAVYVVDKKIVVEIKLINFVLCLHPKTKYHVSDFTKAMSCI